MLRRFAGALALMVLASASCTTPFARAYGGYMQVALDGRVGLAPSVGGGVAPVTADADVRNDLGLGREGTPWARVDLGAGPVNLTGSAFQYSSTGSGTLNVNFGNLTAGLPVDSDMDMTNLKGALTFNLIDFGPVRIAPGVAVDYFDVRLDVTAQGTSLFERVDVRAPVPMGYVQADLDFGWIAASLDAGAIHVDLPDAKGTYIDLDGMLRVKPTSHLELVGGYRWISLDASGQADGQNFDADLTLQGWYVGGGVTF